MNGTAGAVVGTVLSVVIRLGYRGRRLGDIDPLRFGMLGAVVGGVGVPLYLQTMNVLFGAAAAAGSILLARRADALPHGPSPDRLERADELAGLPAAEQRELTVAQRSRPARY